MNAIQLQNCTLDELERFYNIDPNDLGICHALITKQREAWQQKDLIDELCVHLYQAKNLMDFKRKFSELT